MSIPYYTVMQSLLTYQMKEENSVRHLLRQATQIFTKYLLKMHVHCSTK